MTHELLLCRVCGSDCELYSCNFRFHFTTGKFPFEGENVYKLFGAISTGVFHIPKDLSPLLKDLLKG